MVPICGTTGKSLDCHLGRIGISNARPVQGCPHNLRVTSLMLRPSLGAAWLAWKIWPPVGFGAEPLAVAGPPSQRAAPPAWRPRRPSLQLRTRLWPARSPFPGTPTRKDRRSGGWLQSADRGHMNRIRFPCGVYFARTMCVARSVGTCSTVRYPKARRSKPLNSDSPWPSAMGAIARWISSTQPA